MKNNNNLMVFTFVLLDIFLLGGLIAINMFPIFEDISFISSGIIGLYFISNLMMFYLVHNPTNLYVERLLKWVPNTLVGLGLLGTVVGFYYTFNGLFSGFSVDDTSSIEAVLHQMSIGFPIALISSITGIATSILISFKLIWFKLTDDQK